MKKIKTILTITFLLIGIFSVVSATKASSDLPLKLTITSSKTLSGTAGDYVVVDGQINNTGLKELKDITTYLSLVDVQSKLPVDLEDWSAEKGLYIGSIGAGQTMPLVWKIHFVKAGEYSLIIVADAGGYEIPQTSAIVHFHVKPKQNLNPGKVLPVALGEPIVLVFAMMFLSYRRKQK